MAIIEMPKGVTPSMIPEFATPNEWAKAFNVSVRTVYRMCKDGELMTVGTPGDKPDGVLVVTSEAFPVDWYSCPVCGAVVLDG